MSFIEINHVTKTYPSKDGPVEALKDISLSIEQSDIYGIIGMSGAGKSTLVRCLNYLERPTSGEVIIDGKHLETLTEKELRQERKKISMIFQHFNLLMQKNVISNVCFPLRLRKMKKKDALKKANELLELVGLQEKAKAYPANLSGGQKQRVAIARALASDPQILLCDEATSALDPQTTESILELLKEIHQKSGITIVIITHQMNVISEICNKVAIIENGQLVEEGFVSDIFANPKSEAAKRLVIGENAAPQITKRHVNSENLENLGIRVVFSENSAFEPVIANLILDTGVPINILKADTKNVGGIAKGEMILGLPFEEEKRKQIIAYLKQKGLSVQEVTQDV